MQTEAVHIGGVANPALLFAALGDETRLRLVSRLSSEGPLSITGLTDGARVTRQAVTKHLHVMQNAGLVQVSRHGRETMWQLNDRRLREGRELLDAISRQWDDALGRLKRFVENIEDPA